MTPPIISPLALKKKWDDPNLIVLDASQRTNKSGIASDFDQLQITGALHFDLKELFSSAGPSNSLFFVKEFEHVCRRMGINKASTIVVYDDLGVYFSPRVWWLFKTMGHKAIVVLDGGLPAWAAEGYATETKSIRSHKVGDFKASFDESKVIGFEEVKENTIRQEYLLVDARAANRFDGTAPEPRAGIRSGSIPNSVNLPFSEVLENGKYKSKAALKTLFDAMNIGNRPLIFSCGSGVTACIVLLACEWICRNRKVLYEGSWTEWAERLHE